MAEIHVEINGKSYALACADGDEERLHNLAAYVGTKVDALVSKLGPVNEARLLLMAALLITDELQDDHKDLKLGGITEDELASVVEAIANDVEATAVKVCDQ